VTFGKRKIDSTPWQRHYTDPPMAPFPGDDQLSASDLRKQYQSGGSLTDDQLSASQLRARAGIQANRSGLFV
jgi:hypothetical protein